METGLEKLWNNLLLTADEQLEVVIEKNWIEETAQARKNCLLGRMVINRAVNMEAMKLVLQKIWKLLSGLVMKEVGDRVYVFHFEDVMEKDRVLLR